MRISFLSVAEQELHDAVRYYNHQGPGIGYTFAAEVKKALARITNHPQAWPALSERTRRCRVNRFPYNVVYQADANGILVVAIMHMSRRPETWRHRT